MDTAQSPLDALAPLVPTRSPSASSAAPALAATAMVGSSTWQTLCVPRGQVQTLPAATPTELLGHGVLLLRVDAGRIWLTQTGDPDDHFIAAGEDFLVCGAGQVVVECDSAEPARLRWQAVAAPAV